MGEGSKRNVWNWTDFSSKSLLLASCSQDIRVVNFYNTWTKQKWHILDAPINKRDTRQNQPLGVWSCAVLLRVEYVDWEKQHLGFWIEKETKQRSSQNLFKSTIINKWKLSTGVNAMLFLLQMYNFQWIPPKTELLRSEDDKKVSRLHFRSRNIWGFYNFGHSTDTYRCI